MAAILPTLDVNGAAFESPSIPHHRPDTPQLTLHDYHKFQQSPQLSASPDFDTRRVRRKPSIANLAVSPAQASFPWTSTSVSPHFIHSVAPHPLLLSSLPPPPATPRPRPNTASPSLSSTVTTLQSTPTHTPVFRGGSTFEQRRLNERIELHEPVRTKRKFDSLKQAKRLPRRADSGGGTGSEQSGGSDGAIWEVYAAVFEPCDEYHNFEEDRANVSEESSEQDWLQPAPLFARQSEPPNIQTRRVRFREGGQTTNERDQDIATGFTTQGAFPREEQETTATSSYSLSKFHFPVPPGQDNWSGTFGHLRQPSSPNTPTTFHYRGASFDVVNPHASLLLEGHCFETPAEIDGLLDDYFDTRSEDGSNMQYNALTGEASQSSLRTGSDSSRHARVLYEDPDSARRHILLKQEDLPPPPKAVLNDSPLAKNNKEFEASQNEIFPQLPPQDFERKPSTNPFRRNLQRAASSRNANENAGSNDDGANPQENSRQADEAAFNNLNSNLSPSASVQLKSQHGSLKRFTHCSDPFDLTISESGSRPNLMTIEEVLKKNQAAENAPNISQGADAVSPGNDDEGAVSQATYGDQESDPTIKEIIGNYDYTRVPASPERESAAHDSSSIEHGRGFSDKGKGKQPVPIMHLPCRNIPLQEHADVKTPDSAVALMSAFPTPPTPVYTGVRYCSNHSELPTSDRTYGETNQLLNITPETNVYTPAPNVWPHGDYQIPQYDSGEVTNPFRRGYYFSQGSLAPSSSGTVVYRNRNSDVPDQFRFTGEDGEQDDVHHPLPRGSSIYPFDSVFDSVPGADTESAWETEVSKSSSALPGRFSAQSEDSYADTSAYEPENRLSRDPDALAQAAQQYRRPSRKTEGAQRTVFEAPPDAPSDKSDHRRDTQKATSLLSDNILIEGMRTKNSRMFEVDKEQRQLDLAELERLRRTNPAAVREASAFLANRSIEDVVDIKTTARAKLKKIAPFKPEYRPESIFSKVKEIGRGTLSNKSVSERRLLGTPDSFVGQNNLEWSDSLCDFVTIRDGPPPGQWSPFTDNATAQALAVPSPPASRAASAGGRNAVELGRRSEQASGKRPYCPAMNGQTRLHELKLLPSKRYVPQRGRGLTDAELLEREPAWTLETKPFVSEPVQTNNTSAQPNPQQPDIELPRLVARVDYAYVAEHDAALRTSIDDTSGRMSFSTVVFPGLPLVFYFGGFDWIMRKKTGGRIPAMKRSDKRKALVMYFPLGFLFWALVATVISLITLSVRGRFGADNGRQPFSDGNNVDHSGAQGLAYTAPG